MANSFLQSMLKSIDNEYATVVEDGIESGDVTGYISTGSYTLNALLSGSIYGGLPANKVTALAGEPSTGKTFFAINVIRGFLNNDPKAIVIYFESESAISSHMLTSRGVDAERVIIAPVATVQEFRSQAIKALDKYMEQGRDRPLLFVLDSLGNLSTQKEVEDITAGKDTRDMTRSQLIRGAFRVLTLKLGKAQVPLIVTNHVYDVIGSYVPTKKMGGGSGLEYAASTIVFLSKKKDRDDKTKEVTGAIISAVLQKSRLTVEQKKVQTLLNYDTGLDPYYGLIDLAEKFGLVKKVANKYEFENGTKAFENAILKDPEKFFTQDLLDKIDEHCKEEFLYGGASAVEEIEEVEEE